jgi:hypothetical protein
MSHNPSPRSWVPPLLIDCDHQPYPVAFKSWLSSKSGGVGKHNEKRSDTGGHGSRSPTRPSGAVDSNEEKPPPPRSRTESPTVSHRVLLNNPQLHAVTREADTEGDRCLVISCSRLKLVTLKAGAMPVPSLPSRPLATLVCNPRIIRARDTSIYTTTTPLEPIRRRRGHLSGALNVDQSHIPHFRAIGGLCVSNALAEGTRTGKCPWTPTQSGSSWGSASSSDKGKTRFVLVLVASCCQTVWDHLQLDLRRLGIVFQPQASGWSGGMEGTEKEFEVTILVHLSGCDTSPSMPVAVPNHIVCRDPIHTHVSCKKVAVAMR